MSFQSTLYRLARAHNVPMSGLSSFSNRIKHLQRLGWPAATKTGKGQAAAWTEQDYFDLAIALELTGLHVNPETAIKIAEGNLNVLREAAKAGSAINVTLPSPFGGEGSGSYCVLDFSSAYTSANSAEPTIS